jgi:hypothetical protein
MTLLGTTVGIRQTSAILVFLYDNCRFFACMYHGNMMIWHKRSDLCAVLAFWGRDMSLQSHTLGGISSSMTINDSHISFLISPLICFRTANDHIWSHLHLILVEYCMQNEQQQIHSEDYGSTTVGVYYWSHPVWYWSRNLPHLPIAVNRVVKIGTSGGLPVSPKDMGQQTKWCTGWYPSY